MYQWQEHVRSGTQRIYAVITVEILVTTDYDVVIADSSDPEDVKTSTSMSMALILPVRDIGIRNLT